MKLMQELLVTNATAIMKALPLFRMKLQNEACYNKMS
jgi:hypothetical protein